jgi:hypothetical protein
VGAAFRLDHAGGMTGGERHVNGLKRALAHGKDR